MLGKGCNFDAFHLAWVEIWGLEVSPKVRHFLWRLCTSTLPTRALLKARHVIDNAVCSWCGKEEETSSHILFDCERSRELWEDSGCASLIEDISGTMCDMVVRWKATNVKKQQRAANLIWLLWAQRNLWVFDGKATPNGLLLSRLDRLSEEYGKYNSMIYKPMQP
ncbi:uncharacterized protein LOC110719168 [Chenopodium quinoa]|uniref:uncharacterized protein LOC110719168 n=1 Tax=Chenopodium quinoa TaxID=63459 RepID=UPI000B777FF8|nr:uncharacterized protein LOC110719168 [Chenopodium quinoa]